MFDVPDFNARAICKSNKRQGVRKGKGGKIKLVTSYMIWDTKIKYPRSKRGGLREKKAIGLPDWAITEIGDAGWLVAWSLWSAWYSMRKYPTVNGGS